MAAVEAFEGRRPKTGRGAAIADTSDFAWRVLILLNLFRLTIGTVLLVVFYVVAPRIVGETDPNLAWIVLLGMRGIGWLELVLLRRRFPGCRVMNKSQFGSYLAVVA